MSQTSRVRPKQKMSSQIKTAAEASRSPRLTVAGGSGSRQAENQTGTKRRQTHMKSARLRSAATRPGRP